MSLFWWNHVELLFLLLVLQHELYIRAYHMVSDFPQVSAITSCFIQRYVWRLSCNAETFVLAPVCENVLTGGKKNPDDLLNHPVHKGRGTSVLKEVSQMLGAVYVRVLQDPAHCSQGLLVTRAGKWSEWNSSSASVEGVEGGGGDCHLLQLPEKVHLLHGLAQWVGVHARVCVCVRGGRSVFVLKPVISFVWTSRTDCLHSTSTAVPPLLCKMSSPVCCVVRRCVEFVSTVIC